jgi:carbonic anhydrase
VSSTDTFVANAKQYAAAFDKGDLPKRPASRAAVIACMDCRVNVYGVLGIAEGDAHIIRNAGGVVTDDVIRSLTISQRLLGTTEIVLIHHTDCGMLAFRDDDLKDQIEAETGLRPAFAFETFPDLDGDVLQSIARIMASPFIPNKDSVRGFVYEVATGRLREVEQRRIGTAAALSRA